jgi:hypothetical protein
MRTIRVALTIMVVLLGTLVTAPRSFVAHAAVICPIGDCATSLTVAFAPFLGTGTAIPGGTGGFTSFPTQPGISQGNVVFTGAGAGQLGLYLWPPQPIFPPVPIRLGNLTTLIPGSVGTFTSFTSAPIVSGLDISFVGGGANGQQGIYFWPPSPVVPGAPPTYPPVPVRVADLQTPIPSGIGNFTSFAPVACNDAGTTLFNGSGANGQSGLFTFAGSVLETVVATGSSLPISAGGSVALINGTPPSPCRIQNGNVAFIATAADGFQGVYLSIGTTGQFVNIASTFTTMPNSTLSFQSFSSVSYDGAFVAFAGSAAQIGDAPALSTVCKVLPPSPVAPPSPCAVVADTNTSVPGGIGNFLSFGSVVIDPGVVVFQGFSSNGAGGTRSGLYTDLGGKLSKIVAEGDVINGKAIQLLSFGPAGFDGLQVAFAATFTDGSQGIGRAGACVPTGFAGFDAPIGGADATGGTASSPLRAFKLKSTVPVKMSLGCSSVPVTTGVHTIQLQKVSNATDTAAPIDATPTDAATTGNAFRLDDAASGTWHFNLDTKGLSKGVWQIRVTLADGSLHTAFIELK